MSGSPIRFLTVNGVSKPIQQWASETGIHRCTIYARLNKGMSPEQALNNSIAHEIDEARRIANAKNRPPREYSSYYHTHPMIQQAWTINAEKEIH